MYYGRPDRGRSQEKRKHQFLETSVLTLFYLFRHSCQTVAPRLMRRGC